MNQNKERPIYPTTVYFFFFFGGELVRSVRLGAIRRGQIHTSSRVLHVLGDLAYTDVGSEFARTHPKAIVT